LHDLAGEPESAPELRRWRQRMVDHLSERDAPFVISGRLGLRPDGMMTSPNFPQA
jgi:hypothetical protein